MAKKSGGSSKPLGGKTGFSSSGGKNGPSSGGKSGITSGKSGITSGKSGITSGKSGITSGKSGITSSKSSLPALGGKSGMASGKSGLPSLGGKSSGFPTISASSSSSGKSKTSLGFGVIWLPGKRHNKQKKEVFYNSHKDDPKPKNYPHNYFMSGDSPDVPTLAAPRPGHAAPVATGTATVATGTATAVTGTATAVTGTATVVTGTAALDDKSDDSIYDEMNAILYSAVDHDDNKEASGDVKKEDGYLENEKKGSADSVNEKTEKESAGDTMDHARIRPPPEKVRAEAHVHPDNSEDKCVTCLYYTVECCDCSIM